jgi:hypothetical protein
VGSTHDFEPINELSKLQNSSGIVRIEGFKNVCDPEPSPFQPLEE